MNLITYELLLKVASYMQLNGSCYIWKFKIGNKVQSLEILRPDLVMFDENADGSLKGYRYQVNNKNMILNKDEVMAFHNFNPQQAFPYSVK